MDSQAQSRSRLPFGLSWEKVVIWTLFGLVVYSLRHFFDIVFMTFIMSYLAQRTVGFLTRTRARSGRDHWMRRPVIFLIYTAAAAALYLAGQFVLPGVIEQGKWLIGQVQTLDLDRLRDRVLAGTLGKVELARFKRSEEYQPALAEFIQRKSSMPSFGEFKRGAAQIRQAFHDDLRVQEGQRAVEELKAAGQLTEPYRNWLREERAEQELVSRPDLRARLEKEFDASWQNIYGQESFEREKGTPQYQELRQSKVLRSAADEMVTEGRYRNEAEAQLGLSLGEERVRGLGAEELERRFHEFYTNEVPRRWSSWGFDYPKFTELSGALEEQDFLAKAGATEKSTRSPEEQFDDALELSLAKAHPWSVWLGDTSALVRNNMPTVTGWLTGVVNNAINFGLNALLSLMFSAMIVWEVPRMRRSLGLVAGTRAEPIYREIAPGVAQLGIVIGAAFSAQILIALLNAAFTFMALQYLGLPSPLFLSLLVFFFSLVPYVGTIIAGVPILIVGLQTGGPELGLYTALAMVGIHELEAWFLSPKILGDVLNLNPIAVILVLFAGQQLFGVWGLLLAVPVTVFVVNDVLLQPAGSTILRLPDNTGEVPVQEV